MKENIIQVQEGFRILLSGLSKYVCTTLYKVYSIRWWREVLETLSDQNDLPAKGSFDELVNSLDFLNCTRLLERKWNEVFKTLLSMNCRTWANELKGMRNIVAHAGANDLDQAFSERALDTMALLCKEIDQKKSEDIREIYKQVRANTGGGTVINSIVYVGVAQPATASSVGALNEGSLLKINDESIVQKTTLTRKVSFGGKTEIYPVYRVRLDLLYYNDQNDRITTWISKYEAENGKGSLSDLDKDIYNRIIENFIYESNPEDTVKTQKNISMLGQREPGVTLADGRIVDGNRRYTCLRRLQREKSEALYFETVIMDMDIHADRKMIKLLELSIQHGEEKKVDYDPIEYALGTYRDVVQTQIITEKEYAENTNEAVSEVKHRIETAEMIIEFLKYIKLPEQYYVAREYTVYSLFQEMLPQLKNLNNEEKERLKKIVFNNAVMKAMPDQRKFIRDIKNLIKNGTYTTYFEEQKKIDDILLEKLNSSEVRSKADLDKIVEDNQEIVVQMQETMENALQSFRTSALKNKTSENVQKSLSLMLDIDSKMFAKLGEDEKEQLKTELENMSRIIDNFKKLL